MRRVSTFKAEHFKDRLLRSKHCTTANGTNLDGWHGNRDEEIFADPFEFRVDRTPNRQIGFGYGAHMCLGMHLARMEMSIFFQELLPRLEWVELAGKPRRTITNFVGGPKAVPIRFGMRN